MDRRGFLCAAGGAVVSPFAGDLFSSSANAVTPRPALMKVGTQHGDSDGILRALAGFGVNHICSRLPSEKLDGKWSVDALSKLRERVESFGIALDMVPLPLSAKGIDRVEMPNILLGRSPERDREIDAICEMIRNTARVGIPALKYNLSILGVVRTGSTTGRGGATYSTFVYKKAKPSAPLTAAGVVGEDAYWERITHFLKRVIPVAEEYKVRLACHRPRHAERKRVPGRRDGPRIGRRPKALHRHRRQSVSRLEFLSRDDYGDAREARRANL